MGKKTNGKALIIGIVAAVVVLAAILALVLSRCTGGIAPEGTEATQQGQEACVLYWNVDRKEYDGKSEAGLSSRNQASDGFFHVRFFKDGEMLELKVKDRKLINSIDTMDLMGLEFDEDGIVTGVIRVDRMPVERVGWLFYVQSTGGNLIKLNSSKTLNGLEVLVEVEDYTAIYDMTGLEGEIGRRVKMPSEMDRVIALADMEGRVTHVFVTDRSEFMFTVEGECQHCKQTVSWKEFTKTNEFPSMPGHYILKNDIKLKGSQVQLPEDASICVDLNGKTVSKTDGGRMIALFNPGVKFALMDSSEEQTGTILVSGTGAQGLGVWLRYGEFHFYSGTIDATAANSRSGGAAVAVDANTYMYMHGGTIRGGNSETEYDALNKTYSRGQGGAVLVVGKFVMNGGVIEGGKAIPIRSYNSKGQSVNNRGYGGNILARGSATVELNGGIIRNGYAGSAGGNIYVDGTAELLLNGTKIQKGYVDGRGCNGGSIYVGSKASVIMTGGSVTGGYCYNEGGNIYCGGTFAMKGGSISGGKVYTYGTGKLKENCASQNLFLVSGTLKHYAGTIAGGVHAIDASETRKCTVSLSGSPVIDGGKDCKANLTLSTNAGGVQVRVAKLSDKARIGVSALGIFTEKTDAANADNFFSDLGADVIHYQERLAVGKLGCICGSQEHYGACDGSQLLFVPHTKNNTLPLTEGNWYLTQDVMLLGQQNIRGEQNIVLDLNGFTVTTADGARAYALFDPETPITLTLTDSSEEKTGAIVAVGENVQAEGQCVWIRTAGQTVNLYDVTLDASGAVNNRNGGALYANAGTTVNMYAGRIVGGTAQAWYREESKAVVNGMGGNVYINGSFTMHDGIITGGKALSAKDENKNTYTGGIGGNLATGSAAQVVLLGGTIEAGVADTSGGNLYINGTKAVRLAGTAVSGGYAGNAERGIVGGGGNVAATGAFTMEAGSVADGGTNGNGGNIHMTATADVTITAGTVSGGTAERGGNVSVFGKLAMTGGKVEGGNASTGGNVFVYGGAAAFTGGSLEKGTAKTNGGNLYVGADGAAVKLEGISLTGGKAANGGNLAMAQKSEVTLDRATLTGGKATANGGNVYAGGGMLGIQSGTIEGGNAATGGNIYVDSSAAVTQSNGTVTGGKATANGGNLYIGSGASYILQGGAVENGVITRDGAANIDARGTLTVSGGRITGGVRVDGQGQPVATSAQKINVFAYRAQVTLTGGQIDGGVMAYTDSVLKLSGDAVIDGAQADLPGLTLNGVVIRENSLSEKARVVVSNGADTCISAQNTKTGLVSQQGLVLSAEADGKLYLRRHTHCTLCDQIDGSHAVGCQGVDEARKLWDGGDISQNGTYCLHGKVSVEKPATITASDVTILVDGTLTSSKRALDIQTGAKVTLKGSGTIEGKGVNGENTGVVNVAGELVIQGVKLQQIADSAITVNNGGVMTVGTGAVVTMDGGFIQGGHTANGGGNVLVNGGEFILNSGKIQNGTSKVGGNVQVTGGSFTQKGGFVTGGTATGSGAQGGNVGISAGTYTLEGGSVENGKITVDGAGNVDVRGSGKLIITGGSISGGSRVGGNNAPKCNIFSVNGKVEVSGGSIAGGVMSYGASAGLKVSKDAYIASGDASKPSLTLLSSALLTVDGKLSSSAAIVVSNDVNTKIAAGGDKTGISSDKGLKLTVEAGGMYLRAADAHAHCLCARTDGTHAEGCDGFDVLFSATTAFPTTTGNYFVNAESISTGALELGKSDGTGEVKVVLCLNGKTVTTPESNVDRVAQINKNSSLTVTDCGKGSIKPNAKTVNNGSIFHSAAGSTLTIYNGTLDAGTLSTAKNGAAIDNAGTLNIHGGTILGGHTTQRGGAVYNTGSLVMSGGKISGGRAGNRGGNIYSENGHVTVSGGIIENGKAYADTSGNLDVRNGSLTISGGTISGGNRYTNNTFTAVNASGDVKRNIFTVNTNVTITGGQIDGGVQLYTTGSGFVKISGKPKIVSSEAGKKSLSTGYVMTILAPGLDKEAKLQITSAPAGAFAVAESGLTLTDTMAKCFVNASGTVAALENNQLLFK